MRDKFFFIVCVALLFVYFPFAVSAAYAKERGKLATDIVVTIEGEVIHYEERSLWEESEFVKLLQDKDNFISSSMEKFEKALQASKEGDEYVTNMEVEFEEAERETIFRCDICNAITVRDGEYRATFRWLLLPLGLDFIESEFEEGRRGLFWKGDIEGVPINITIDLPPQEGVYAAWHHPYGHCHAHAWWPLSGMKISSFALAKGLTEQGWVMYGSKYCGWCKRQKEEFGEAFRYISYIDCTENREACERANITAYPCWVAPDGRHYIGYHTLMELEELMRGYEKPEAPTFTPTPTSPPMHPRIGGFGVVSAVVSLFVVMFEFRGHFRDIVAKHKAIKP
ncbi:MAG: protein disulfide isomerase family protein [Candidatus Methanospirareceae archaeon]